MCYYFIPLQIFVFVYRAYFHLLDLILISIMFVRRTRQATLNELEEKLWQSVANLSRKIALGYIENPI